MKSVDLLPWMYGSDGTVVKSVECLRSILICFVVCFSRVALTFPPSLLGFLWCAVSVQLDFDDLICYFYRLLMNFVLSAAIFSKNLSNTIYRLCGFPCQATATFSQFSREKTKHTSEYNLCVLYVYIAQFWASKFKRIMFESVIIWYLFTCIES